MKPANDRILCIFGLVASLCAVSCDKAAGPISPSVAGSLAGTEWSLTQLDGQSVSSASARAPTLMLAAEGARASGFAGCNQFGASYTTESDRLRFGAIALTRMFCSAQMDLEQRYMSALEATRTYRLTGQHLELVGNRGVVALLIRR
jgi:heat shock protein HslJ